MQKGEQNDDQKQQEGFRKQNDIDGERGEALLPAIKQRREGDERKRRTCKENH